MEQEKTIILTDRFGELTVLFPVVTYDYPRSFVCRSAEGSLFLLDEVKADAGTFQWVCVKTTTIRLNDLNEGNISIQDCYRHPEPSFKKLYLITKTSNMAPAQVGQLNSLDESIVPDGDYFPKGFLPDFHGARLQSLAIDGDSINIVLDEEKECSPTVQVSVLERLVRATRQLLEAFGIIVDDKMLLFSLSPQYSLVASFYLRKPENSLESNPTDYSFAQIQDAVKKVSSGADVIDVSSSLDNDIQIVKKCSSFVKAVYDVNKKGTTSIAFASNNLSAVEHVSFKKETSNTTKKAFNDAKALIEKSIQTAPIEVDGSFSAVNVEESRNFIFYGEIIGHDGPTRVRFPGKLDLQLALRMPTFFVKQKRYHATMIKSYFLVDGVEKNITYKMTDLQELQDPTTQMNLLDNK